MQKEQNKNPDTLPSRWGGILNEKERDKLYLSDLIEIQDTLAKQIGVLKRLTRDKRWSDNLRARAEETLILVEKEYWEVDIAIENARGL
jgi:hypothetical protein